MVRRASCRSNQALGGGLIGGGGGGGRANSLSRSSRVGQSVRDQLGEGGGERKTGVRA